MSFISKSFPQEKSSKFVSEQEYIFNLEIQTKMSPKTLEQLRDLGVDDFKKLKLEFFFYTDKEENAKKLTSELEDEGYEVSYGPSASDKKLLVITGWTKPMQMDENTVREWTRDMCSVGYEHDCQFDGWGTSPKQ